ncbi:hypothetical protein PGB90_002457 [Kerria lacca]
MNGITKQIKKSEMQFRNCYSPVITKHLITLSLITGGLPVHGSSSTSAHPFRNSQYHFRTCCTVITSLL